MFSSFLLFIIIGFLPYVGCAFGLDINLQYMKKLLPSILLYFAISAFIKLFAISAIIPEVQSFPVQSFFINLFINSFEFIAFRYVFYKNKVKNEEKGHIISFLWASLSAFSISILTFISNSRSFELEPKHITFAFSTVSHLFLYFAMERICLSLGNLSKITQLDVKTQFFILLTGLPGALSAIEPKGQIPAYVPDLLRLVSTILIWALTILLLSHGQTQKKKE